MSMTATIAGASVGIQNASFGTEDRIEERTRCSFTVIDLTGTTTFSKGQPVTITDSALGTMFTGYVNQPKATVLYPNPGRLWAIDCIDETWLADKRTSQKSYKNQFAGTVFVDQIQRYGAAEGLTCKAALRWDELLTDWQAGTLTGVAATTNATDGNVGDGDLELTRAGSQVVASGAGSGFSLVNGLLLTGYASSGYNAAYTNRQIWVGSQALHTGDAFLYDVWINSSSPAIKAGCDFICSDGTVFSGSATQDKQFLSPLTSTDLSGLANDQWYTRVFLIPAGLNGKTLSAVLVGLNSAAAGTYTTYFRRIEYEISGGGTVTFFGDSSTLQTNIQVNNQGYTNVSLTQVQLMDKTATVTPGALSISAAGIVQSSQMSWEQVLPNGCTILRETSIDNGASWQAIMSGSAVPNLLPGMVVTGRSVSYRDTLTLGSDPTVITIGVGSPTLTVSAAYAATKTDLISTTTTTANFVAGTLTNLATVGANGISLNGVQENWDDGDFSNQPMFGGGTLFQQVENKQMVLQTTTGFDLRSQLLFAGQWQNFTAEVDVTVYGTGSNAAGSVYRTSSGAWQNNNDTYAYTVMLSQTQLIFGRGTNSGSGAGAFTSIATATISLAANSVHRLKIIANGSNHQLFVDSVLLINATDATYPAAGYLGLRIFNGTGSTQSAAFDNFGVAAALSGTWQSPSINIAGPGTYGNSEVFWDIDGLPDSTTSITAQTSIDGGSTFQNVTNGGAISGLTAGGSLTGKTLILKLTLAASNAPVVPALNGATVWVMGQYSSSGTRSTAPLGYDTFVRANQSGWGNAIDGQSWTVGSGSGTAAIASDTGTLTATGGGTTLMHLGSGSAADMGATCRVKYTNAASAVRVGVRYTSASGGTMYTAYLSSNQLGIQKFVAGAATTLASMTFTQTLGSYYQLQIVAQGTTISASAWLDGSASPTTFLLTATDSAIASGGFCVGANLATGDTATFNQFKATLYPDPGLSLANVGRAANSLVNWNANLPTNTSMTVQTSVDNGVTWSTISSAGNAVPNIATQPATIADSFTANTSANYTQSNFASGVTGTWTWDTSHSRLTGSGGTNGTLVHNPALTSADSQVMADFDQCDGSGVIANYIDSNNLYFMQVWDGSGTGTQNSVKLFKRSGGVTTQLGSTATIATWTRGNYRRFILDVQAGVLTASMDGVQLIQQTDGSPLAAGKSGLLLNTLVRCYNLRIQQYGQLLTSSNYLYSKVTLTSTDPTVTPQLLDKQELVSSTDIGIGKLLPTANYIRTYVSANLADLNTQSGTTWWYVRPDKSVVFQDRTATPAPWILDSANVTPFAGQQQGDVLLQNLELDTSGDLYRNRQILTGVIGSTNEDETKNGDGSTRTWNVAKALTAPPTVWTLNGQPVTFGIQGVDTGRQFYYQIGSTSLTQDGSGTLLAKTDTLAISYPGAFVTEVVRDNATPGTFPHTISQAEMAAIDGTTGIVENVLDVSKQNMTVAAEQTYGDQLLQRYGLPNGRTLTFMTLRPGLAPGQALTGFVLAQQCNNVQFLVAAVSISTDMASVPGGILYWYSIEAVESATLGSPWRQLTSMISGSGG